MTRSPLEGTAGSHALRGVSNREKKKGGWKYVPGAGGEPGATLGSVMGRVNARNLMSATVNLGGTAAERGRKKEGQSCLRMGKRGGRQD